MKCTDETRGPMLPTRFRTTDFKVQLFGRETRNRMISVDEIQDGCLDVHFILLDSVIEVCSRFLEVYFVIKKG